MTANSRPLRSAWKSIALAAGCSACVIAPAVAGGYADQYGSGGYGATSRYGNYSDQYGARNPIEDQAGPGYADQFNGRPYQPPPARRADPASTSSDAPSLGALDPMNGLTTGLEGSAGAPALASPNGNRTPASGADRSYGLNGQAAGRDGAVGTTSGSSGDGLLDGLTSDTATNGQTTTATGAPDRADTTNQPPQSGFADQYVSRSQNAGKEPSLYGSPTPPQQKDNSWTESDSAVSHAPPHVEEQSPLQALKDVFHNAKSAYRAW